MSESTARPLPRWVWMILLNLGVAGLLLLLEMMILGPRALPKLWLPMLVTTFAVGGSVEAALIGLSDREFYRAARRRTQRALFALAILLSTCFGVGLATGVLKLLYPGWSLSPGTVLPILAFSLAVATLVATLRTLYADLKERIEQKAIEVQKLRELEARSRLAALQGKVNPHFLFNTLNTMVGMVRRSPRELESLILALSDLYRRVLLLPEEGLIPLSEEIELVRRYLEVEQVRLGPRLRYEVDLGPGTASRRVPPMLVEPLVENALKHGISPKLEGGTVRITAREEEGGTRVTVEDDGAGVGSNAPSCGFGLYSIRERLRLACGGAARLEAGPVPGGGFRAELLVPHAD